MERVSPLVLGFHRERPVSIESQRQLPHLRPVWTAGQSASDGLQYCVVVNLEEDKAFNRAVSQFACVQVSVRLLVARPGVRREVQANLELRFRANLRVVAIEVVGEREAVRDVKRRTALAAP